jgi:membrane fusion protein, multidrug efflux system
MARLEFGLEAGSSTVVRMDAHGGAGLGGISIAIVEEAMSLVRRYSAPQGVRRGQGKGPVTFLFMGAAILTLTACGDKNAYVPPPPPKVVVAQPLQQPVTRYIELTGNTQAINTVDLEARVQGFLEKINYVDGSLVKKDQVLFEIQRNTYEAQLEQAKATLAGNQAGQLNAQIEYDRQSQLQQQQVSTQAKLDDAKQKLDQAIAGVENAKASLQLAQINLGYTEVAAPFDGIATRHLQSVGSLVGYAGPTKLNTVVQIDPIYVYFNISETIVLRIKEALARQGKTLRDVGEVPVEIGTQTETGYPHKGKIDYVAPEVDPSTGTLQVRAILDNKSSALLPGFFVRVRVPVRRPEKGILVEDVAIGTSQIGQYVLIVGKDNIVEQRPVKLGQLEGQLRVVESGLAGDEWVITDGLQRAIPGNKVEPEKKTLTASTEQ